MQGTTTTTTTTSTTTTNTNDIIASGEFSDYGSDLKFTLDNEGNLSVDGEVSKDDWDVLPLLPWDTLQDEIVNVVLEDDVAYIGESAFISCAKLTSITIKNSECELPDSADAISETATICGYEGSTAQAYAEKYGRKFVPLEKSEDIPCDITGDGIVSASDATLVLSA